MTCDEDKPWQNAIIGDLIKAQWWGPKGDAKRLGSSKDNVYLSVPIPMLALVACAVECTLTGLGLRHNFDFNDAQYRNKWLNYVELLGEFQQKSPSYISKVTRKIQECTGCYIEHSSSPSKIRHNYNFEALEESAKEGGEGSH
ncbi:hypothetical protein SCLCIDRAFT_33977 [Scleroderma citrinum Foug A]|uniref:DUF6532 domain-containing protein n=1 Tax=Scleroderma citrinum Foug A TaxID=1036808 RepID=A0A0C3CQE1_9AGAM|nr:hypothetical protein SCLCIDRAFT_33977 [Scleroderma citrinum Foug A]